MFFEVDLIFISSMWHNGEIRKEKILNNNWYETCNYFKPKETICKVSGKQFVTNVYIFEITINFQISDNDEYLGSKDE